MTKAELRKKYQHLRKELSNNTLEDRSLAIANNALQLPIWDKSYYHIFLSISEKKEVLTDYILHILQGKDKSVCIPKADFDSLQMEHILLQENTLIKVSAYGIPEPVEGIAISPQQFDVVFVPLLAFDKKGNRIGYGKGFYDRFLAKCRPDCLKIGLSYFEAEDEIIHEYIDFPLNYCITAKKVYSF
ncbi:5-formyltetrahydrofolate cyclo-ligase [Rasiella rasia]|uniref:5-formyltetrahydrofolate cyclo-ligase n=1 Tax=Rasiella rasia TaxID=2744027 RepID=A0A6G6GNI5_9FLAO|nr:5-formyltetrahydrofolate cyclo-ligase [Rasiella rasia]QIE60077.1 5-formyltetrahydrofolate cyclo-ligase [Rasiella rasia]